MQYGAHPAGEGGEYETLTLDTPLFSHRIRIVESEVVVSDPEPNLVAYLRVTKAELDPKDGWVRPSVSELRELLGLDEDVEEGAECLDEQGRDVYWHVKDAQVEERRDVDPEECDSHENSMEIPTLEDIDGGDTPVATQTQSSNGESMKIDGDSDSDEGKRPTRGLRPMTSTMRRMQGAKGPRKGPKQPEAMSSPPAEEDASDEDSAAFSLAPPPGLLAALAGAKQEDESPDAARFVQRGRWFVVSAGGQGEGDVANELRAALDTVKGESSIVLADTSAARIQGPLPAAPCGARHTLTRVHVRFCRRQHRIHPVFWRLAALARMRRRFTTRDAAHPCRGRRLRRAPAIRQVHREPHRAPCPGPELLGAGEHRAVLAGCNREQPSLSCWKL